MILDRSRSNESKTRSNLMRILNLGLLGFVLIPLAGTSRLPAGFSDGAAKMIVEIDGVSFGAFDPVILGPAREIGKTDIIDGTKTTFQKIVLKRHFVTDQSLYKWADVAMKGQSHLKDVILISENAEGVEIARHVLKNTQPVSAIVEASNPEVGGLHEKVEFAVQSISKL
ncbi:MAG: hypothetical protein NT027_00510 [Proteobacteria bacterium]|nr:hypothetical protein [Pseudomonadota bacterium]